MSDDTAHITRLLHEWARGDQQARDELIPIVYRMLHRLAEHYLRNERHADTLQATDFNDLLAYVRATISYDPNTVEAVSFKRSGWLTGDYKVTKPRGNTVKIRVDAANADNWKSGSGEILRLRFRKKVAGSSRLDFVEGIAYNGGYTDRLGGMSGGTINAN